MVSVGPGCFLRSGRPATHKDIGSLIEKEVFPSTGGAVASWGAIAGPDKAQAVLLLASGRVVGGDTVEGTAVGVRRGEVVHVDCCVRVE
jgi:hypothetical protein